MKRRDFIAGSAALPAATLATLPQNTAAKAEKGKVQAYRQLGRTGIRMSDISFGAGRLPSASMVLRAIDRGINYFDTAPDYGASERHIGEALKRFKQRDQVYIASKFCADLPYEAGVSHLQLGSTKADYKRAIEASLQRLNTDYLDVAFVHAMGELKDREAERRRLLDENMLAAADELKQEGKIRYLAVSSHGPYHMEELMLEAVRSGHFDLVMMAFNFMKFPRVPEVLKEAADRGVGVIAMKTLAGAKDMELDPKGAPFEHAAFKWVLQHPEVAGLVVTMKKTGDLDHYLAASGHPAGEPLAAVERRALDRYAALFGAEYCRTGCSLCEGSCPVEVPIAEILRYQMYFEDYGDEKQAMASYARLGRDAAACGDCAAAPCAGACPHGLPVALKLRAAHDALSLPA